MSEPNLFDEAPSELSQDAFFCWIFKWLNIDDPNHRMRKAGWDLLQRILEKIGANVSWQEFHSLQIKRQFYGVDIVAVVQLQNGQGLVLVVEDKVKAELTGGDQLERNIQQVVANQREWEPLNGVSRNRIHGVFLKTGYDFDLSPPDGYVKINRDDLTQWTDGISPSELNRNNILRDWVEHFRRDRQQPRSAVEVEQQIDDKDVNSDWSDPAYQLEPFRREREQTRSAVDEAQRMDNTSPDSPWWSNAENQYKHFKGLFCVTDQQLVPSRGRYGGKHTWFVRQGEPPRREYFDRLMHHGEPSILYNFEFPLGYWDAEQAHMAFPGTCFSYYYRLTWLNGIWGIALRFWKAHKSPEEVRKMHKLAEIYTPILREHNIVTHPFTRADQANEATLLLIDPVRSPGLASLYDAHLRFVSEAGEQGLW